MGASHARVDGFASSVARMTAPFAETTRQEMLRLMSLAATSQPFNMTP